MSDGIAIGTQLSIFKQARWKNGIAIGTQLSIFKQARWKK